MRKLRILFWLLFAGLTLSSGVHADGPAGLGKILNVEDIFCSDKYTEDSLLKPNWIAGDKEFSYLKRNGSDSVVSLYRQDVQSGQDSLLLNPWDLPVPYKNMVISEYAWSKDDKKILLKTDKKPIWRYSKEYKCYAYDPITSRLEPIRQGEERISNAKFSPDGNAIGYVLKNNIYVKDLVTGQTKQWTQDGSDLIINGQFDWVYEEEFGITDGWSWSPDSKAIAFWRMDQTPEPEFSWIDYNPLQQKLITIHYPKVGEKSALVKIGVIHLDSAKTIWMDLGAETDLYIPRILWTANANTLSIQRMNRAQNRLELLLGDANTGETRTILTETDPCWVEVHDNLSFLKNKTQFIWTSERDGFNHIYLYNMNGKLVRQLTKGNWEVSAVEGVDEDSGFVYFTANADEIPEHQIYRISLKGKKMEKVSNGKGKHEPLFSSDFTHFIDVYSNADMPPQTSLCGPDGSVIRILVKNKIPEGLAQTQFLKFQTTDGETLQAFMVKPLDFDEHKRYPVLIECYGGPAQNVVNFWEWNQWSLLYSYLAQEGYIVFKLENRGTNGRGKTFRNLIYGDFGKWAINDHIEGAKYLAGLPYVDKDRIGIMGWSFGGYLTLLALTKGSDYFKTGVAIAPVTDWRLYDNIYTERYMRLPAENQAGYDSASVFSYIDRLKGKLLIVHGLADDNVHVQNSMQLIERLQALEKQFSLMVYPNRNHSLLGKSTRCHLMTLITDFILDNL